jgi:NTE family protein
MNNNGHGLVLGGGGVLGIAWEVGVLAALGDAGINPLSDARTIVGTSAGTIVASRLLLGHDIAAIEAEQHIEAPAPGAGGPQPDVDLVADLWNRWTTADHMTEELARECGELAMKATALDESLWIALVSFVLGRNDWPDERLKATAVNCDTGERVAWSSDDNVDIVRAAASSCSVPGRFPPITVEAGSPDRYTDGGLWSATNADLAGEPGTERVLVIEPLSVARSPLGRYSARQLSREIAGLEAAGIKVEVLTPSDAYADLTPHMMDPAYRAEAVSIGRRDATAAAKRVADVLASNS